jgi:20S proteasome subunit beta 6
MVGGVDEEGKGAVYGYDAVGSFKRDDYGCMGSGQNYIMPILDNLVCCFPRRLSLCLSLSLSLSVTVSLFQSFAYVCVVVCVAIFHRWEQIGHKNRLDENLPLSEEEIVAIMKEVFVVATERDIYTGDSVEIKVIRKEGIKSEVFQLKKD